MIDIKELALSLLPRSYKLSCITRKISCVAQRRAINLQIAAKQFLVERFSVVPKCISTRCQKS